MKNKNKLQVLFASALFLACLLQSAAMMAQSQQAGPCTNCSCGGNLFAGPCQSGQCCGGTVAQCLCGTWSTTCACVNGVTSMPSFEPQHESNILGIKKYLEDGGFSSPQSGTLASLLPQLIKALKANDVTLYQQTGRRLDDVSSQLPANEKQLINNWIASRGGTTVIH